MPLQRHPALIPLSREHHQVLLLAQLLKSDTPDYKSLPSDISGKLAYTQNLFDTLLFPHFKAEEQQLLPLADNYPILKEGLQKMANQHREIKATWATIYKPTIQSPHHPVTPSDLHSLGLQLQQHVRYEERQLFTTLQETLTEEELLNLTPKPLNP